jgi:hypothetical protein
MRTYNHGSEQEQDRQVQREMDRFPCKSPLPRHLFLRAKPCEDEEVDHQDDADCWRLAISTDWSRYCLTEESLTVSRSIPVAQAG